VSRAREGMTLIEVMVALVIISMLGITLYVGFVQSAENKDQLELDSNYYRRAQLAVDRMQRELSMAYVSIQVPDNPALVTMRTCFIGTDRAERDRVDFTSFSHQRLYRDAKESDQNELSYFVARHPDDGTRLVLARREQNRPDDRPESGGRVQILLDDVRSLELEYLDPMDNEWSTTWDTTQASAQPNRLPMQVRIVLTVPDLYDRSEDRVFATHAELPVTWALNHAMY
jgi:general secretion pathway protein J